MEFNYRILEISSPLIISDSEKLTYREEFFQKVKRPIRLSKKIVFPGNMGPPMDIYSFGMCALEMAALEIFGNGDSGNKVTEENIRKTIESLEDEQQKDFIQKCLQPNPEDRPTAKDLLFHSLLFEVHTLKLLAAHCLVRKSGEFYLFFFSNFSVFLMRKWCFSIRKICLKTEEILGVRDGASKKYAAWQFDIYIIFFFSCSQLNTHKFSLPKTSFFTLYFS